MRMRVYITAQVEGDFNEETPDPKLCNNAQEYVEIIASNAVRQMEKQLGVHIYDEPSVMIELLDDDEGVWLELTDDGDYGVTASDEAEDMWEDVKAKITKSLEEN